MIAETHMPQGDMLIRDIIDRMRHDGCGGRAGKVELLTGIEGASSRPVRRIVLVGDEPPLTGPVPRHGCGAGAATVASPWLFPTSRLYG